MEVPANLRAQQTLVVYVSNTVMALIAKTVIQVNKMQGRYGLLKTKVEVFLAFYTIPISIFSSVKFKFKTGYPILRLFEKGGEMNYRGPKDLESLEYFVHDKLNTETKKVINWENSLMK